jgi:GH35 family endo-1,4-beta-xylanase
VFSVGAATTSYSTNLNLPAGTHFVRTELTNASTNRKLTIANLQVTGATVSNSDTSTNALAAANTYITNFRKGTATIWLTGPGNIPLLAGTSVPVDMARNAFNFGGTVSGSTINDSKDMLVPNPATGTEANQFQQFINSYFNTIVPSNGGKWANNEPAQGNLTMQLVDRQLAYAQAHNMRARMHNLIWGSGTLSGNQQPGWVNTLISSAAGGNADSKTSLRNAIGSRINYYVGTSGNRSQKYIEIDVHNEALWNPSYWNIFNPATAGASTLSIASIFNDVAAAATSAGNPNLRLYLNEFNVVQFSPASINSSGVGSGSDQYANWYRNEVEAVRNAGGAVSGIGMQEYVNLTATGSNAHSAATIQKALQNLSVEHLALTMAEYGHASGTTSANAQSLGPQAMDDAVRMFYGNPLATTFMVWGWWDTSGNTPPAQMIVTTPGAASYTLTALGQKWVSLMNEFSTHTTGTVDANSAIQFNGFYGDYNIGSQSGFSNLTLAKGTSQYALQLAAPPKWFFWNTGNSGNWSNPNNWSNGAASAAGDTAYFAPAGTARSVTVDGPRTVGMIALDSSSSYTVGGSTITLAGLANQSAVYVAAGSHQIDAPIALANDTTFTIAPAASTLTVSNLLPASFGLIKKGSGTLAANCVREHSVDIENGKIRTFSDASQLDTLTIAGSTDAWTARLDLDDTGLVINSTAAFDAIYNQLTSGYANGAWSGFGVMSTAAAANSNLIHKTALGFGTSDALGVTSFQGIPIANPSILIAYALSGDANLDGTVNALDFNAVASNFGVDSTSWVGGDFNYDGTVNTADFILLSDNFNLSLSSPPLGNVVPEPSSLLVLATSAALLRRRVRR